MPMNLEQLEAGFWKQFEQLDEITKQIDLIWKQIQELKANGERGPHGSESVAVPDAK